MSAPRTSTAIADDLAEWRKGVSSQPLKAVMMEAIAALRPALPAEVEAVLAKLLSEANEWAVIGLAKEAELARKAATLLRRYAQAVAEKDAEIARLTGSTLPRALASAEKKLQAVEALCANARCRDRVIYPGEILDILEWE